MNKGFNLANNQLINTITAFEGLTTSDGSGSNNSLIDSVLIGASFVVGKTVLILSGDCEQEDRAATGFNSATGEITVSPAFSAQIVSGVKFRLLNISSVETDVKVVEAAIGDPSGDNITSISGKIGDDTLTIKERFDNIDSGVGILILNLGDPSGDNITSISGKIGDDTLTIKERFDNIDSVVGAYSAGKKQLFQKSITSAANAGDVTVATINTQDCKITGINVRSNGNTTADLTSIGIYAGASKVITLIDTTTGAKSNIDAADKQVGNAPLGGIVLAATKTIVITLTGTGATAVDLTVTIEYEAVTTGGYLS
jgi:hypothetical protein